MKYHHAKICECGTTYIQRPLGRATGLYPEGYSLGPQDLCPGCTVRRTEYAEENASYTVGKANPKRAIME
jgi:hypothetical protein